MSSRIDTSPTRITRTKAFVLVFQHAFSCAVTSVLAFVVTFMTTVVISIAAETNIAIPGLFHTRPGRGDELASTNISSLAFLYPAGCAVVLFSAVRLAHHHRRAKRAPGSGPES